VQVWVGDGIGGKPKLPARRRQDRSTPQAMPYCLLNRQPSRL
jgi:hypothetical protein